MMDSLASQFLHYAVEVWWNAAIVAEVSEWHPSISPFSVTSCPTLGGRSLRELCGFQLLEATAQRQMTMPFNIHTCTQPGLPYQCHMHVFELVTF